jgi:hypothetical protein
MPFSFPSPGVTIYPKYQIAHSARRRIARRHHVSLELNFKQVERNAHQIRYVAGSGSKPRQGFLRQDLRLRGGR